MPRRLPPPALQFSPQLLDLAACTFGEHADRAHTDHDLAGRVDIGGNLDPTPGEADVNGPLTRQLVLLATSDRSCS